MEHKKQVGRKCVNCEYRQSCRPRNMRVLSICPQFQFSNRSRAKVKSIPPSHITLRYLKKKPTPGNAEALCSVRHMPSLSTCPNPSLSPLCLLVMNPSNVISHVVYSAEDPLATFVRTNHARFVPRLVAITVLSARKPAFFGLATVFVPAEKRFGMPAKVFSQVASPCKPRLRRTAFVCAPPAPAIGEEDTKVVQVCWVGRDRARVAGGRLHVIGMESWPRMVGPCVWHVRRRGYNRSRPLLIRCPGIFASWKRWHG